jgi:hypothetical protein
MFALSACSNAPTTVQTMQSPDASVELKVIKKDLGACCSNVLEASASIFGEEVENLLEIQGSSDVRYQWTGSDALSVVACNARKIAYRSSFSNADYSRRFVVSVQNEAPQEANGSITCTSERFQRMKAL